MGLLLQSKAGQFGVGDPTAYGKLWRGAPLPGPWKKRISPSEQELGIHLLGKETLDVKQPFGDTVADPGIWIQSLWGKEKISHRKKPLGTSRSVCVDMPSMIAAVL